MLKSKVINQIKREIRGASKLSVTVNGKSVSVSKEAASTPVKFKILSTVFTIIQALPAKFLKNATSLSVAIEPISFTIRGETEKYAFTIASLAKNARVEPAIVELHPDFEYFCKLFGIAGRSNGVFTIDFQFK